MPRTRPPYLLKERTRHGKVVWYVRIGDGPRTRIKGEYGSSEFLKNYSTAISGQPEQAPTPKAGTLESLVSGYMRSRQWEALSQATRSQRGNILKGVLQAAGKARYRDIDRAAIVDGRDRRTPSQGRHFLDTMRGMFKWAVETGRLDSDPAAGIKYPAQPKTSGFPAWTEDDVARYHAKWPVGTRERVWIDMLLYTGLRRGDVVKAGPRSVKHGVLVLITEKTGTEVTIPILPILQTTLDAGPTGETFVISSTGQPFSKESFGNAFREACEAAGVKKRAHGVRKIAATTAANNGATVAQLEAIFGWTGGRMASLYTASADRRRLAREAIEKLKR